VNTKLPYQGTLYVIITSAGLWRQAVGNKCNCNCLRSFWACPSYCSSKFITCDVWLMYCTLNLMHSVLHKLTMDGNMFCSWDYRNQMYITYRYYGNEQCWWQVMMWLTSQASPNIVPAAILPIARPRIEAMCSYGFESIGCIEFPLQYCWCSSVCYSSQPSEYWHQNFIFGTLLLMLSIINKWYLTLITVIYCIFQGFANWSGIEFRWYGRGV
jgi:hypothetical protein